MGPKHTFWGTRKTHKKGGGQNVCPGFGIYTTPSFFIYFEMQEFGQSMLRDLISKKFVYFDMFFRVF